MEISFSNSFKKGFRKRVKNSNTEDFFWKAVEVFVNDPFQAQLKTHKLSGNLKGLWSFSIGYDLRVVFYFTKDKPQKAVFIDIGTHDEVY
ncbi:MAG TPA: type II toxin-antitoxin system mRNA interferase toxin, RelE/StbE family [Bacteroidia bacterium]|nr:type II toxin-antitoxin system mRNA interferase toxin, RelE/StbE family [Bacteroidia bacterium]